MANIEWIEQALGSVSQLQGIKGYVIVGEDEHHIIAGSENLSRPIVSTAVAVARDLLQKKGERCTEVSGDQRIGVRRLDNHVICAIASTSVSDEDLLRKLNVIAIRVQLTASREPLPPVVASLRDAYVDAAGPLSGMVFDRAMEQQRSHGSDSGSLRVLVDTLATALHGSVRQTFQTKARSLIDAAEPAKLNRRPSGTMQAAQSYSSSSMKAASSSSMKAASSSSMKAASSSSMKAAEPAANPPAAGVQQPPTRRTTVPQMTAIAGVARNLVGAFGDMIVQRALLSPAIRTAEPEQFIQAVATELPEDKRAQFLDDARRALEIARAV